MGGLWNSVAAVPESENSSFLSFIFFSDKQKYCFSERKRLFVANVLAAMEEDQTDIRHLQRKQKAKDGRCGR